MRLSQNINISQLLFETNISRHSTWVSRVQLEITWDGNGMSISNTADRGNMTAIVCEVGRSSTWTFVNAIKEGQEMREIFGDLPSWERTYPFPRQF